MDCRASRILTSGFAPPLAVFAVALPTASTRVLPTFSNIPGHFLGRFAAAPRVRRLDSLSFHRRLPMMAIEGPLASVEQLCP